MGTVAEGDEGQSSIVFTVRLDKAAKSDVVINYESLNDGTAINGTATVDDDFDAAAGSVTIPKGQRIATVSVSVNGDTAVEANESVKLLFSGDKLRDNQTFIGWIRNDDSSYTLAADQTAADEGATASFTLTTVNVADGTVLPYSLSGVTASDVTGGLLTGSATVTAGKASISIALAADSTTEGAETLSVALVNGKANASTRVNDTSLGPPTFALSPSTPADNATQ